MSHEERDKVEVIDPSDRRYKDDNYFRNEKDEDENFSSIHYRYGCGCPFGCLSSIFISVILSILLTFLLNWMF
ncbi:hypothetical protein MT340_010080 [Staphylococcus sp. NRL 16/872]|uniref:hypothetical protein n=1 Tax=Staphylococcus sp. NRL 16/872 TaxID=2930131 RepID=UPI001FB43C4E|nr:MULTISPECIES: hypothetical protein [unclassified Staphylococcus]MCJ1656880.1 hypothetical protein [Staphylococcus sp. NRL 21/187]MCJ1662627.1 hypothetical protein [Staphylococcus sp. NRL 18/288]WEN68945.1 hypothetical protein MT340_010080 [Staphylococcus sp. NRL 16/872]